MNFEFFVEKDRPGHFTYEDKEAGITLVASTLWSFSVIDDRLNIIEFAGSGRLNGEVPVSIM